MIIFVFIKILKFWGRQIIWLRESPLCGEKKMKVLKDLKKKKFIRKVLNFKSLCGSIRIGQ